MARRRPDNMARLEQIVAELPEAERLDVEGWGEEPHPAFKIRGKNFVFAASDGLGVSLKLSKEEAAAVVATDDSVAPAGYGLGRAGWIDVTIPADASDERWVLIREWVRMSYTLVAPKKLARDVIEQDT